MPKSDNPSSEALYVGIDVGGTNIKAGIVTGSGKPLAKASLPTHADRGVDYGLDVIQRTVEAALANAKLELSQIEAIGLATPGTMDIPGGWLLEPPNLPGWWHVPIRDKVAAQFKKPTVLQNDANAAAYGEFWTGAARDAHSLVFWTLGTGIGCGIIVDHVIIEGEHSHGSECGHIIIDMDSPRMSPAEQYGTLEAFCGAKAVVNRCAEALASGRESSLHAQLRAGAELTPLMIAEAAEGGDRVADEVVMDTARYMGIGTTTLMHTINPSMFLFGGAMTFGRNETALGRRFLQAIKDEVKKRAFHVPFERTTIDFATLGGDAGYIGAAGCARLKFPPA
ncbi:MAG TPA: ROK family protein [Planctomycetaceae bacterium]|jgi:glucokinase|nr:ROK family protein [Planctomycetaceae bacterium]